MVDSVNALYYTLTEIISLNFEFINDPERLYLLKVIVLFTFGSISGLVFFSNILSSLLKKHKSITISIITGFIAGSLLGVWPWKNEDIYGNASLFFPDFTITENEGILAVELNQRNAPQLKVSRDYVEMIKGYDNAPKNKRDKEAVLFIKQKVDAAKWFIEAVKQRQNTLLVTINAILELVRSIRQDK